MFYLKDHLEKLHSFVAMAERGSIRKASVALGITQPALSRQIAALEASLDQSLFERSSQGITLTEAGKVLKEFSQKLLRDAEDVEMRIRKPDTCLAGTLHIGTFESLSIRIWPRLMTKLREKFPAVRIGVATGDNAELYQGLLEGRLDLAMALIAEPIPAQLHAEVLFEDAYGFYCAPHFPLKRGDGGVVSKRVAMGLPMAIVDSARCVTGGLIVTYLSELGLRFRQLYEVDTFEAGANYAREGVAAALLPGIIARPSLAKGKLIPLRIDLLPENEFCRHKMGLIYKKERRRRPILMSLQKELRKLALADFFG